MYYTAGRISRGKSDFAFSFLRRPQRLGVLFENEKNLRSYHPRPPDLGVLFEKDREFVLIPWTPP